MWLCVVKLIFHFVQWGAAESICTHTNDCYLCLTVAQVCPSVGRANTHRLKELQHQAAGVQPGPTMDLCTVLEGCSSWLWNPSVVWVAVTTMGSQEFTASASEVESNASGCIWDRWHWQLLYWDCSPLGVCWKKGWSPHRKPWMSWHHYWCQCLEDTLDWMGVAEMLGWRKTQHTAFEGMQ